MKKNLLTLLLLISTMLYSCKKDTPEYLINQPNLALNFDGEHQFMIKQDGDNIDAAGFSWTSSDPTVGVISAAGLFSGRKIGKTTIKASGNGTTLTSEVTINPYSNLCREPYTVFGSSKATVKSKETRVVSEEIATGIQYQPENSNFRGVVYLFEADKLTSTILFLGSTQALLKESATFLAERYTYEGITEDDVLVFSNNAVLVGLGYHADLGYHAFFIPNTTNAKSSIGSMMKNRIESIQKLKGL